MVDQRRKDFLIRKNKGKNKLQDFLSGVSCILHRDITYDALLSLDATDTFLASVDRVARAGKIENIIPDHNVSELWSKIDNLASILNDEKVYCQLYHYGNFCGLLKIGATEVLKHLIKIVHFDRDDVFIYDQEGKNGVHLELLEDVYFQPDNIYCNIYEFRVWGTDWTKRIRA